MEVIWACISTSELSDLQRTERRSVSAILLEDDQSDVFLWKTERRSVTSILLLGDPNDVIWRRVEQNMKENMRAEYAMKKKGAGPRPSAGPGSKWLKKNCKQARCYITAVAYWRRNWPADVMTWDRSPLLTTMSSLLVQLTRIRVSHHHPIQHVPSSTRFADKPARSSPNGHCRSAPSYPSQLWRKCRLAPHFELESLTQQFLGLAWGLHPQHKLVSKSPNSADANTLDDVWSHLFPGRSKSIQVTESVWANKRADQRKPRWTWISWRVGLVLWLSKNRTHA